MLMRLSCFIASACIIAAAVPLLGDPPIPSALFTHQSETEVQTLLSDYEQQVEDEIAGDTLRHSYVRLDYNLLAAVHETGQSSQILFNLFSDAELTVDVSPIKDEAFVIWSGVVVGESYSYVRLYQSRGQQALRVPTDEPKNPSRFDPIGGTIDIGTAAYRLRSVGKVPGLHVVEELDRRRRIRDRDVPAGPPPPE